MRLKNTALVRPILKGAPKSTSFISISYRKFNSNVLFIGESTPLRINALLISPNGSLKRIFMRSLEIRLIMTYLQIPCGWVINKRGDIFCPQKISRPSCLDSREISYKFFSRNDSTVPRVILKKVLSPMNSMCKIDCRY